MPVSDDDKKVIQIAVADDDVGERLVDNINLTAAAPSATAMVDEASDDANPTAAEIQVVLTQFTTALQAAGVFI